MNVLIIPLYGIGDTLMTTPAIEILKRNLDVKITNLCMFKTNFDLLRGNPFIDEFIFFPFMDKDKFEALKFVLKMRKKFKYTINFYPSNRWQYNLLCWLFGARKRIGHRYIKRDLRELNFLKNLTVRENEELHNVQENVRLLEFFGIKTDTIPKMRVYLNREEMNYGVKFVNQKSKKDIKIGIHTGTSSFKGHVRKRWAKEKFLALMNGFPEFDFFLFGTHEEELENRFILDNAKYRNVFLVLDKTIREVASIINQMNLFVSNDSGLMHLAAAVGIPVVAIFGPTNPKWVSPWGVINRVIRAELPCSPCFYYSPRPLECKNKVEFQCLRDIEVETVMEAILDLIQTK